MLSPIVRLYISIVYILACIVMILQMLMSVLVRSILVTPMPTVLTTMVVSHVHARQDTLEVV